MQSDRNQSVAQVLATHADGFQIEDLWTLPSLSVFPFGGGEIFPIATNARARTSLKRLRRGYRARLRLVRGGLDTASATSMGASFNRPVASSRVNSMRQTGQRYRCPGRGAASTALLRIAVLQAGQRHGMAQRMKPAAYAFKLSKRFSGKYCEKLA